MVINMKDLPSLTTLIIGEGSFYLVKSATITSLLFMIIMNKDLPKLQSFIINKYSFYTTPFLSISSLMCI